MFCTVCLFSQVFSCFSFDKFYSLACFYLNVHVYNKLDIIFFEIKSVLVYDTFFLIMCEYRRKDRIYTGNRCRKTKVDLLHWVLDYLVASLYINLTKVVSVSHIAYNGLPWYVFWASSHGNIFHNDISKLFTISKPVKYTANFCLISCYK